jgi:hypothetical protein
MDQYASSNFDSANSLKQQSVDRHVASHGDIILAPISQKVVNRKLGRTTVFTIYDRFTKLTEFRYTTFFGRKLPTGSEQS